MQGCLKPVVLSLDVFDVWHKLTLDHQPIPFAPNEPPHRDVIRIRPPAADRQNRLLPGVFDTVLFLDRPQVAGLARKFFFLLIAEARSPRLCYRANFFFYIMAGYRAGRIRTIFRLPPRLHNICSGRLAYVELFSRFQPADISAHHMPTVFHDVKNGQQQALVIPVEDVALACHLGPWFSTLDANVQLHSRVDSLSRYRHFFLNPFYNSFLFLHLRRWQHLATPPIT